MHVCLRVLTESNKSRFHSYSVGNGVLMISHLPFGIVACTFFPTTLNSRNSCIWTGSVSSCSLSPFSLLVNRSRAAVSTAKNGLFQTTAKFTSKFHLLLTCLGFIVLKMPVILNRYLRETDTTLDLFELCLGWETYSIWLAPICHLSSKNLS